MGNLYKALKEAKKLIAYEQELLDNAKRVPGVSKRGAANVKPA
jgi:flagellar biosynthesis regulator FlbT